MSDAMLGTLDVSGAHKGARFAKVVAWGSGGENSVTKFPSSQLLEDPFLSINSYGVALRLPPYSLEQLVYLAETYPIHASALEQKVVDIVADGPTFKPAPGYETTADKSQLPKLIRWFESLAEGHTTLELLQAVWNDYETTGWGTTEVVRDANDICRRLYHMPAHTVRAHTDGVRFAQIRMGRMVWFKAWNTPDLDFSSTSGKIVDSDINPKKKANEVLIFRKLGRRSTWYGIPTYISAIGHISLAISARDYNLLFFENAREPRHLIIVTGLEEDISKTIDDLVISFRDQLKDPHHNLLLPLIGDAKVQVEKMAYPQNDIQFSKMMDQTETDILIAHRMPPDRVGFSTRGLLGGSAAETVNQVYKDGVVRKGQSLLRDRLNRFLTVEYEKAYGEPLQYEADFEDLDLSDETADINNTIQLVHFNLITLNEGRARMKLDPNPAFKNMTYDEYRSKIGPQPPGAPGAPPESPSAAAGGGGVSPSNLAGIESPNNHSPSEAVGVGRPPSHLAGASTIGPTHTPSEAAGANMPPSHLANVKPPPGAVVVPSDAAGVGGPPSHLAHVLPADGDPSRPSEAAGENGPPSKLAGVPSLPNKPRPSDVASLNHSPSELAQADPPPSRPRRTYGNFSKSSSTERVLEQMSKRLEDAEGHIEQLLTEPTNSNGRRR